MKFLRKLRERASGRYKRRERRYAPVARKRIGAVLASGGFGDPRTDDYLRFWEPILEKQKRVGDLTWFIGSKAARRLLGVAKEEVEPPEQAIYERLLPWLDPESGLFDFGGIRLVPPANEREAAIFSSVFSDILLAGFLGREFEDIARGISAEGEYEYGETVRLRPGDVVMDCGANMGFFSALAARRGCRVHAFEPSEYIRTAYLDRNASLNGDIAVHPYALSDRSETLRFYLDRENIGSSARADNGRTFRPGSDRPENFETVEALTMDAFVEERGIERVDFIKADIEGSERLMLRGARETLRRHAPRLSICTYHLPDDPQVLEGIIRDAQPRYTVVQGDNKLFAWVAE